MRETMQLDADAVGAWLERRIDGFTTPVEAEKFASGQSNPTFLLKTPDRNFVLRRKPPGQLLKSAHAVDREYRVQRALADTDVPVPEMHVLCEEDSVAGSMFYVMEAVDGRSFEDPRLQDQTPETRRAMFADMCRVLAAIHSVDVGAVGLGDFGKPGDYYARQLDRWTKQYRATETETLPEMDALIDWLHANMPPDDGRVTLVHGDYRLDNLLFAKDAPRVAAVLDWELSTLGHPYADLAGVIMQWRLPPGREGRGLHGVDRKALGIPEDEEFIASYCEHMGLTGIERFDFRLAFAFFRMAAILQGVKKRALDGNASNPEQGLKMGELIPQFARKGLEAAG